MPRSRQGKCGPTTMANGQFICNVLFLQRMTRTEIIVQLWGDADIRQAIGKMQPAELHDDLRQEMFLVICELEEGRLLKMHAEGWVKFFLVRTMLNMVKSDRSTFFKKFRQTFLELSSNHSAGVELLTNFESSEVVETNVIAAVESLPWYDRELLKLYAEDKNIAKLSKDTRIPYRSLFKTITKAKIKVRKAMQKTQGRLMGHDAICTMQVSIDIQNDKTPEQVADVLAEISAVIRERIAGRMYGDVNILAVDDLKISKIK
jgi:hypothetical protein